MTRHLDLSHYLTETQRLRWDTLRGSQRSGIHTLPDGFAEAYDNLAALADLRPPADPAGAGTWQRMQSEAALADWHAQRDAQAGKAHRAANAALQPAGQVIEDHLAPALTDRMRTFTADVTILGHHAGKVAADDEVVAAATASTAFGQAWARYTSTVTWYLALRTSWAILRTRDDAPGVPDPLGTDSILAEVANATELLPDTWRNTRISTVAPWPHAVHARLTAILAAGGRVWMPSARQQNEAYSPHVPPYQRPTGDPLARLREFAQLRPLSE